MPSRDLREAIARDETRDFTSPFSNWGQVIVLITPRAIEKVADRIEQAYAHRNP